MIREGELLIKVVRGTKAKAYRYEDLIGKTFSVLMFDMRANEYTVMHEGQYRIIRAEDVEEAGSENV